MNPLNNSDNFMQEYGLQVGIVVFLLFLLIALLGSVGRSLVEHKRSRRRR